MNSVCNAHGWWAVYWNHGDDEPSAVRVLYFESVEAYEDEAVIGIAVVADGDGLLRDARYLCDDDPPYRGIVYDPAAYDNAHDTGKAAAAAFYARNYYDQRVST